MLQELVKAWLIPPAANGVLLLAGLLIAIRYKAAGQGLILASAISLLLLSTDYVAATLERSIQEYPALSLDQLPDDIPLTIVVAGGSHARIAEEYGHPTPTAPTLKRLHYASFLHRKTGHPVMLTGGLMYNTQIHSDVLAESFKNEFKTEARWRETKSRSTDENAKYSAEILLPLNRKTILLVTHSHHMKRAVNSFEKAGFTVIPAPTIISRKLKAGNWKYWVPNASGLQRSSNIVYEYLGLARDMLAPKPALSNGNFDVPCDKLTPSYSQ